MFTLQNFKYLKMHDLGHFHNHWHLCINVPICIYFQIYFRYITSVYLIAPIREHWFDLKNKLGIFCKSNIHTWTRARASSSVMSSHCLDSKKFMNVGRGITWDLVESRPAELLTILAVAIASKIFFLWAWPTFLHSTRSMELFLVRRP